MITFYCGLSDRSWSHHPPAPGPLACVSPVYGRSTRTRANTRVNVPQATLVLQDSGAFPDSLADRLDLAGALRRQDHNAEFCKYADQIVLRASYDLPSFHAPDQAADQSIAAARYLSEHRNGLRLVLTAQGSGPEDYLRCAQSIVPLLQSGDVLGLGGFCPLGKYPSLLPRFRETMRLVVPFLGREGVGSVHLWGCLYAPALGELLRLCDEWGIALSGDSSSPALRPRLGRWGYADWSGGHIAVPPILESCRSGLYHLCVGGCLGLACARHVELVRAWLARFRETRWYTSAVGLEQLSLW